MRVKAHKPGALRQCKGLCRPAHLHLDKVEDLLLALGIGDFLQLLGEAAQHGAAAGLVDGRGRARIRALVHDCVMARDA